MKVYDPFLCTEGVKNNCSYVHKKFYGSRFYEQHSFRMTSSLQKSLIHYGWFGPDSSLYCPNTDFFIYYGLIVAHIWGFYLPPQPGMYYYIWLLRIGPNIGQFELFTSFIQILLISHFRKKILNFHLGKFGHRNSSLNS